MTLSTRQQQKLYKAAKDRINHLLGGASYKDLNPRYYDVAFDYISEWEYVEA